jgi:hypothetical protein
MVIRKGTKVRWKYGNTFGRGRVEETYNKKITKSIKGADVTRFGKRENKVLLIKTDEGDEYLKLENEVERDNE